MKSLFFALAVFSLLALPASAAATKIVKAPPPESISKVTGVNPKTQEVTLIFKNGSYTVGKHPTTYKIDGITTITINHVPGKFADIRVGMQVLGTTERDAHTLDNITLESAAPTASK